ncbi:MAG TPA: hypothetical protein VEX15_04245 [Nocardioidaceae bacterium]|nr:hypothetical protein [Nocardioidaceae bacterium]
MELEVAADPMGQMEALQITDDIKSVATSINHDMEKLLQLLDQAQDGEAHLALGYRSWTAYLSEEFSGMWSGWADRSARQELVVDLRQRGMSTRAIAPLVGVGKDTVLRDITASGATVSDETVDEQTVVSRDGSVRKAKAEPKSEPVIESESSDKPIVNAAKPIPDLVELADKSAKPKSTSWSKRVSTTGDKLFSLTVDAQDLVKDSRFDPESPEGKQLRDCFRYSAVVYRELLEESK